MKLCAGQIKYLAAIKELSETTDSLHCVHIARHLGVSRPSVSKMLRCLANSGLVYEDYYNSVLLTPEGKAVVDEIFSPFNDIYTFFHSWLKIPHDEAHEQALRFISDFPKETCERLRKTVRNTVRKV